MDTRIFIPFAGTMLLTMVVWIYMYARRLPFLAASGMLKQRQITPEELARRSPPGVAMPSDNLQVAAAWAFFVLRVVHSLVHCTFNFIPLMVIRLSWQLVTPT